MPATLNMLVAKRNEAYAAYAAGNALRIVLLLIRFTIEHTVRALSPKARDTLWSLLQSKRSILMLSILIPVDISTRNAIHCEHLAEALLAAGLVVDQGCKFN